MKTPTYSPAPDRLWSALHRKIKPSRQVIVQFDQMVYRVWSVLKDRKLSLNKVVRYIESGTYYGEFVGPSLRGSYYDGIDYIEDVVNESMPCYDSGSIG